MADTRTVWLFKSGRLRRETRLAVDLTNTAALRDALDNQVFLVTGSRKPHRSAGWRMAIMGPTGYPHIAARVLVTGDGRTLVTR